MLNTESCLDRFSAIIEINRWIFGLPKFTVWLKDQINMRHNLGSTAAHLESNLEKMKTRTQRDKPTPTMPSQSSIGIDKLYIPLPHGIGLSAFSLECQPCYILLTLTCHLKPECLQPSASNGGLSDDWDCLGIGKSVNYSALGKTLYSALGAEQGEGVSSLSDLARVAAEITAGDYAASLKGIDVVVERPKALLFSDSVDAYRRFRVKILEDGRHILEDEAHKLVIQDLRVDAIIGLHPHEREEAQRLAVDIEVDMMRMPVELLQSRYGFDYKTLGRFAYEVSVSVDARHR